MGTKLGNIHVRNASVEEVSVLLPKALVGQWSEGFVSAYQEDFQWGSVEREGKKLSRKLPAALVLTAALFDDDVVNLELFQAGKRLAGHLLNPYEEENKPGNVRLFCGALDLPPEDEKRLKVLWKKGDACEQLDLTAALLGAPLWADAEMPPKEKAVRDAAKVDAWLADHPDPPRVKSATRAEVLQELPRMVMSGAFCMEADSRHYILTPTDGEGYRLSPAEQLWRLEADRGLVCVGPQGGFAPEETYRIQDGRIVSFQQIWAEAGSAGSVIGYDSQDILPWQEPLECEGRAVTANDPKVLRLLPDGGFWGGFLFASDYGPPAYAAARFGPDGRPRWSRALPPCTHVMTTTQERIYVSDTGDEECKRLSWLDLEGRQSPQTEMDRAARFLQWRDGLYLTRTDYLGEKTALIYLNADLDLLGRAELPGLGGWDMAFSPAGDALFLSAFDQGLWLLDPRDLSIRQQLLVKDKQWGAWADGAGRYWVGAGSGTLMGYDETLRPVSRHRLKGSVCGAAAGEKGLTAVAYSEAKYDYQMVDGDLVSKPKDPKRPYSTLRVYRIS